MKLSNIRYLFLIQTVQCCSIHLNFSHFLDVFNATHNDGGSCIRRYPNGADGSENCLTLDIYTSSVVYNDLQPVVVYIDGDDLSQEEEEALQPSASLAHDHKTVFVSVNYRYILFSLCFA